MRTLLSFGMAYCHIRTGLGRVALSILAIALGVALVVAVRLMNEAVLASFLDRIDQTVGRAALTVTGGEGTTFSEKVVQSIGALPGVDLAVPLVRSVAFPDDGSGELLTVFGVDLTNEAAVRVYRAAESSTDVVEDVLVFLSQPDSIVLGREFALSRWLDVGSTLSLVTPTGVRTFTVRGLLDAEGPARTLGGRLAVMDLYAAQRAFTADGQVSQIDLVLGNGVAVEAVKATVAAMLPAGLTVEEPEFRKDVVRKTIGGFQVMLTAFSILAVLTGLVMCYSRLGAIFEARTWEIGLLRSVGLRQSIVFGELLKESLLLGAMGTAVGLLLGMAIAHYGMPIAARTFSLSFRTPVVPAEQLTRADAMVLGAGVGLLAAVLAALVPALRLARKEPVAALRMRGRDMPFSPRGHGGIMALALVLLSVGLIAWQQISDIASLGLITTVALAVAAGAGAGPIVQHGARWLTVLWRSVFGVMGEFAGGHLREQARRVSMTVATLGLGLGAVLMFGLLAWSAERSVVAQLSSSFKADLVVSSPFASAGYRKAPLSERVVSALEAVPGVVLVAGERTVDLQYGSGGQLPVLKGYDAQGFIDTRGRGWPLESGALPEALALVARGDAVLVTSSFAHRFGARPGQTLDITSPSGPVKLSVAGVTTASPEAAVIMSRNRYRISWNDPSVDLVHVALAPGTDRETTRTTIMQRLNTTYRVRTWSGAELVDYFAGQMRQAFSVLYLLVAITFLLILAGIGDTLATGVIERTREFAMLRAVGLHRAHLFTIVMLEGMSVGLLGVALAILAGIALGFFWTAVQFPALVGWRMDVHFPTSFVAMATGLTLLICLVGSLLPSLRAAHLSVHEGLRNE
jgi:putative ABC transport system permease protein